MSLSDCIASHTHRQYAAWLVWLDGQWNVPDRHDSYLMQIAAEVRRVLSRKPNAIKLSDFQLTFQRQAEVPAKDVASMKAVWLQRVGIKGEPGGGND